MFDFISILLIFLEKSISMNVPYNFVAVTYITYLVCTQGVGAYWKILVVAMIISLNSLPLYMCVIGATVYYLIFYWVSTFIGYKRINLPLLTLIQVLIYLVLTFKIQGMLDIMTIIRYLGAYGIFNYLYIGSVEKGAGLK